MPECEVCFEDGLGIKHPSFVSEKELDEHKLITHSIERIPSIKYMRLITVCDGEGTVEINLEDFDTVEILIARAVWILGLSDGKYSIEENDKNVDTEIQAKELDESKVYILKRVN